MDLFSFFVSVFVISSSRQLFFAPFLGALAAHALSLLSFFFFLILSFLCFYRVHYTATSCCCSFSKSLRLFPFFFLLLLLLFIQCLVYLSYVLSKDDRFIRNISTVPSNMHSTKSNNNNNYELIKLKTK